jgi:hypothetical protein
MSELQALLKQGQHLLCRRLTEKPVEVFDPKKAAKKAAKALDVAFRVQGYVPKRGSAKRVYNP